MVLSTYAHLWPDDDRTRRAIDGLFPAQDAEMAL